jgi:glycosyltransferase involved in cell wall biosynthesis
MKKADNRGLCIVSYPLSKAFNVPIFNLSKIFSEIDKTQLILGISDPIQISKNRSLDVHIIPYQTGTFRLKQIFRYILLNVRIVFKLFSLRHEYGQIIFFMESPPVLPIFFSFLFCKKRYWLLPSKIFSISKGLFPRIESLLSYFGYWLSDGIIIYSPHIVAEWSLESNCHKIFFAHEHFLDFGTFTNTTPISIRPRCIGYIGRLSEEKGVQNFIFALPAILRNQPDLAIFIGGEGPLREMIVTFLKEKGLTDRVDLMGWISHEDLPHYLNHISLLILPSYTEGLPNIMLEAMACGTPVLTTPVGAIPDVIRDDETGFIMGDNSPECITENVIRALSSPDLERIVENGRYFAKENFTFEKTVEQWREILDAI